MTKALLVVEGYDRAGRDALLGAGATVASTLYADMLTSLAPGIAVEIVRPADPDSTLPSGAALADFAGIAWTGSSLTVYEQDARVLRQVALAREAYAAGVPQFGSCWAIQIAAIAAGGQCRRNPRGREFGVARAVALTADGRAHPLYTDKTPAFSGFASHLDEVERLPEGAILLASNRQSEVHAAAIRSGPGEFWAVQYHPEFDLKEMAAITRLRVADLAREGFFADIASGLAHAADLETLHRDPARRDIAWKLGLDADVLDRRLRTLEVRNWLTGQVGLRLT